MMTFACTFLGHCRKCPCHGAAFTSRIFLDKVDVNCLVRSCTYLQKAQMSRTPPPYVSLFRIVDLYFLNNLKKIPFINKKEYIYSHPGHFSLTQRFNLTKSVHDAPRIALPRPGRTTTRHVNAQSHDDNYRYHIASQIQSISAHYFSSSEIVVNTACILAIDNLSFINRRLASRGLI